MFVFNELVTDDALKGKEKKIIRKIRCNAGLLQVYLICLSQTNTYFDIIPGFVLKQKSFPKDELYILGLASSKEQATLLAGSLFVSFSKIFQSYFFKQALMQQKEQWFRRR